MNFPSTPAFTHSAGFQKTMFLTMYFSAKSMKSKPRLAQSDYNMLCNINFINAITYIYSFYLPVASVAMSRQRRDTVLLCNCWFILSL